MPEQSVNNIPQVHKSETDSIPGREDQENRLVVIQMHLETEDTVLLVNTPQCNLRRAGAARALPIGRAR